MNALSLEMLYSINGGDPQDYSFGYKIGQAAKTVCNAVSSAWDSAVHTVKNIFS